MFQYYSGRNPHCGFTIVMTVNELWELIKYQDRTHEPSFTART